MPLWESNELYFVAGFSLFVTLGIFASVIYFVYKRSVANGRREDEEQAALEKVLLRKGEAITTSPPTKPLIVSPSFSSPNKVPANHLRSGSYSPTHYLSPYHNRQPRRNSSPTSSTSSAQQTKTLPNFQLHHPQLQLTETDEQSSGQEDALARSSGDSTQAPSLNNERNPNACVSLIKTHYNNLEQGHHPEEEEKHAKVANGKRNNGKRNLAQCNSQYYGTIPPRRFPGRNGVAPAKTNLVGNVSAFLPVTSGPVTAPHLKSDYVQLPGIDNAINFHDLSGWKNKDEIGFKERDMENKHCSPEVEKSPRRKSVIKMQCQQKQKNNILQSTISTQQVPVEMHKNKYAVTEEIPYYISSQ